MRVQRHESFQGTENYFPPELRDAVRQLIRRLDAEFDGQVRAAQNMQTTTADTEATLFAEDGSRLLIEYPDGSKDLLTVDFGQDRAQLE